MDTTTTQNPTATRPAGPQHDAGPQYGSSPQHDAGAQHDAGPAHDFGRTTAQPPLYRPWHDRMLAGVASGVARYFGVDATVVRIIFAVLTVVGGAGVPLYLAGWLLIPDEGSGQSIASSFIQSVQTRSR